MDFLNRMSFNDGSRNQDLSYVLIPGFICPRPTATEAMVEAAMFDSKRLEMRVEDMV